jgi:RimJ/RimL family protein N-acetyltransferase
MNAVASHERSILPMRVDIDNERWVSIRPIERDDASALSDFYARLSPESRRRRFFGCGEAPIAFVQRLAGAPGFVGVLGEHGPLDGAIVAHGLLQPDGPSSAEISFAVADDVQGHGVGKRLVGLVLELAAELRLERVTASTLAENAPMRRLLIEAGHPIMADRINAGVEEVVLDAGVAHPVSA